MLSAEESDDAFEFPIRRWELTSPITLNGSNVTTIGGSSHKVKIVIEQYPDTFVAFAKNIPGVVVDQGDTFESARTGIESAIRFHLDTFGQLPKPW